MYEDLNEVATLRFNKELESISNQTREKVREMQNEYAALTGSSGLRSGPQEAAIGRAQIEGSERLVHALYEIWVDLVKRRNGHISRPDVDFIGKKLEGFAQTQRGHLHKAFSTQRMGAVVNLLTEEAGRRLYAATANARRDLAIMVREHELFSPSTDAHKQNAGGNAAAASEVGPAPAGQQHGHHADKNSTHLTSDPSPKKTIWAQMWSWGVVGAIVLFVLGGGIAFMTSDHPWAADGFYMGGTLLFLVKFWTWEDARQQPRVRKQSLQIGVTLLALVFVAVAIRWNHIINRVASNHAPPELPTSGTEATPNELGHNPVSNPPIESKPEGPLGGAHGPTLSVADRVKIIIAGQFQVDPAQLKPTDDFEANLGADPSNVYFLMRSLELEYNITIPTSDSSNLHTVGETISYIEKRVQGVQGHKAPALRYILESDFNEEVLQEPGPVLVFFCTQFQDPCRVMEPTISSVAQEQRKSLKTVAVDVNINKIVPQKYGADYFHVPVTILFSGGAEKGRITGAASREAVERLIANPQAFGKKG